MPSTATSVNNVLTFVLAEMFTVLNVSETENRHSAVYSDWEREHNYVLSVYVFYLRPSYSFPSPLYPLSWCIGLIFFSEWQSVTAGEVRLTELKAVPEGDEEKAEGEEFVGGKKREGEGEGGEGGTS
jgi:hypothetical protein